MNIVKRVVAFVSLVALLGVSTPIMAQENANHSTYTNIPHRYKFSDNIFWGGMAGVNYPVLGYASEYNWGDVVGPYANLYIGKAFTKWFSARLSLDFMSQKSPVPEKMSATNPDYVKKYSFGIFNFGLEAMFNMNTLFHGYHPADRIQLYLLAGGGGAVNFGYHKDVKKWGNSPYQVNTKTNICGEWHAGAEVQVYMTESFSFLAKWTWNFASNPKYNGLPESTSSFGYYNTLGVGIVYRFSNQYGQTYFANYDTTEEKYYDEMNRRLQTQYKSDEDNVNYDYVILFPIYKNMLTEQQKKKVDKLVAKLEAEPSKHITIDIYSNEVESDLREQYRVVDRTDVLRKYIRAKSPKSEWQIDFVQHKEASPLGTRGVFALAAIVSD